LDRRTIDAADIALAERKISGFRGMSFAESWKQDSSLLPEKALATIIASFNAHALSRKMATVISISAEEMPVTVAVPKLERFKAGSVDPLSLEEVELNPAGEECTRKCDLNVPRSVIDDRRWVWLEAYLKRVGEFMAFQETDTLAKLLIDGADNAQALGADDHYKALVKCVGLIEVDEQRPDLIAVNGDEAKDLSLLATLVEPTTPSMEEGSGPFCYIRGIPAYSHPAIPSGTILVLDTNWAGFIGERQGLRLENWATPERGLVTAAVRMRCDYKLGLADAVGKVTGA